MMQSWRNLSTTVPTWSSSSIYSGTFVEQLPWDCSGIQYCLGIGLTALGFCMTVRSFSSSYILPPILPLGLHWDCCWIEVWVGIAGYVILLLVLTSLCSVSSPPVVAGLQDWTTIVLWVCYGRLVLCDWGQDGNAICVGGLQQIQWIAGLRPPVWLTVAAIDLQSMQS